MTQQTNGAPAEYRRLADENARLRAALREYGQHPQTCKAIVYPNGNLAYANDPRCDCGLRAALEDK